MSIDALEEEGCFIVAANSHFTAVRRRHEGLEVATTHRRHDWSAAELVADLSAPLVSQDEEGGHLLNVLKAQGIYCIRESRSSEHRGPDMRGGSEKLLGCNISVGARAAGNGLEP